MAHMEDELTGAVSSALHQREVSQSLKNARAQFELLEAQRDKVESETRGQDVLNNLNSYFGETERSLGIAQQVAGTARQAADTQSVMAFLPAREFMGSTAAAAFGLALRRCVLWARWVLSSGGFCCLQE